MKKTLPVTIVALLAGAVSVYAQGSVSMADFQGAGIQVFLSQSTGNNTTVSALAGLGTGSELMGNSGDTSTYNYASGPVVSFKSAPLGAGYTVELLAGPSTDTSVSQLVETQNGTVSAWNTGSAASGLGGFWNGAPNAIVAGVAVNGNAAVAIAAWNNEGGTITSLAAAIGAGDPWGVSNLGSATGLGGGITTPPVIAGLDSFSLVATPEPSTIALGVMGASALLFRRRK
jgi:hypothetical protein